MSLSTNVADLATRVATEAKSLRTLVNGNTADLTALATTAKASLVAAINELHSAVEAAAASGGPTIDDGSTSPTTVWSSSRTAQAVAALVDTAPGTLDTLNELAAALGDDPNFAATISGQIGAKADDTAVVHLAGAETLSGVKTFAAAPAVPDGSFTTAKTTGLDTALSGKAPTVHAHAGADITSGTVSAARLPAASETASGIVELATTAEATTGLDTARAVTPAGVKAVGDTKAPTVHTHTASQISDSTTTGRSVLTAADAAAARTAIGAGTGTSNLVLGTTAGTAKAGDYAPPAATTGAPGLIQLAGHLEGTATAPTVRYATEAQSGLVELATTAETTTGTDTIRAVHPAGLKAVADTKANTADVGSTTTDYVALFNAGLV